MVEVSAYIVELEDC